MSTAALPRVSVAGKMRSVTEEEPPVQAPALSSGHSYAELQRLVDQAANVHVFTAPAGNVAIIGSGTGIRLVQPIHPMTIEPSWPAGGTMRSTRWVAPATGHLDVSLRWILDEYVARPDRQPPESAPTAGVAQRFVIQDGALWLHPQAGFRLFGAGRAFRGPAGDMNRWIGGAVCNILEGFGVFRGLEGNCTWCGDLSPSEGFRGHIMIRVRDPQGRLVTNEPLPVSEVAADAEPEISYLTWLGQKVPESRLANTPSLGEGGQVRGLNIPVDLKLVSTGWAITASGFRAKALAPGDVIGLEIGFGRESAPRSPLTGNGMAPYQFEGVSKYTFHDRSGATVGTVTANVLEGRSMTVNLEGAPGQPALRFGFFGPLIAGTGCFAGARGVLYGASGSVFNPPPLDHVISNWYALRLYDTEGKFRCARRLSS